MAGISGGGGGMEGIAIARTTFHPQCRMKGRIHMYR